MRGAHDLLVHHRPGAGIIPADAGSTPVIVTHTLIIGDHPRGCGEHIHNNSYMRLLEGSSPRMRGAPM